MKKTFKDLETVYYVDTENGKIIEALWWNWNSRCGSIEYDIITPNLSLKDSNDGDKLKEKDKIIADIKKIFKTKEEAIEELKKLTPNPNEK